MVSRKRVADNIPAATSSLLVTIPSHPVSRKLYLLRLRATLWEADEESRQRTRLRRLRRDRGAQH